MLSLELKTPNGTADERVLIGFAVGHTTFSAAHAAAAMTMDTAGAKKLIDSMVANDLPAPYGARVHGRRFHAPRVMEVLLARP